MLKLELPQKMQLRSRAPNADVRAFFLILAHHRNRTYMYQQVLRSRKCTKELSTHVPLPRPATFGSRRADKDNFTFIFIGCGYVLVRVCIAFALWPCREWILDALDLRKQDVFVVRSRFRQTGLIERRHKCQLPSSTPAQTTSKCVGRHAGGH